MLHCFKKHKSANDTTNEICMVYGNVATSVQTVRTWFRKFRAGNFNLEDEERSERPFCTNMDVIVAMVEVNPRYTVRELADILKIPLTTIHNHLTRLGYVSRSDVWLPHEMTERNILERVSICDLLLQRHKNEPFLKKVRWKLDVIKCFLAKDKLPLTVAKLLLCI